MMKKMMIAVLLLLLAVCVCAGAEESMFTGTVQGGSLKMRSAPDSGASVVKTLKTGTKLDIFSNDGTWCSVRSGDSTGYVMTEYLKIESRLKHLGWGKTADDGSILPVYAQADENGTVDAQYMSGISFELLEKTNGFYKVRIGSTVGYVKENAVIKKDGDYSSLFVPNTPNDFIFTMLEKAPHDIGDEHTRTRGGALPYDFDYPSVDIPDVDSAVSAFLNETLSVYERDHVLNHSGEDGKLTVRYQATSPDGRYGSILLMGEYRVGTRKLYRAKSINFDRETGKMIDIRQMFTGLVRSELLLEAQCAALMPSAFDGYDGTVDDRVFDCAVLTGKGMEVYLMPGLYLPLTLGIQKAVLPYEQIVDDMRVDSGYINSRKREIDPTKPMIALTFDDGPSEYTDRILNVLAEYGGRATFCVQGYKVEENAKTVRKAVALGNEIANHTWNHQRLTDLSSKNIRSQLTRTNEIVSKVTGGYQVKVLRPPYGAFNSSLRNVCKDLDMIIVTWLVDTEDWDTRSSSKTYKAIINGSKKTGTVILMHDLYYSTAEAVIKAVPELIAKGVQLVTVSELMSYHKDGVQPGTVYMCVNPENIRTR